MALSIAIAILAGLASGAFHLAILAGTIGALIFGYITTLPLFAAGLALGWPASAIAGIAGLLVVMPVAGLEAGFWYAIIGPLPVAFLTQRALLWQEMPGGRVWYPAGYLVTWMVAWASLALLAIALWQGSGPEGLQTLIERRVSLALGQWEKVFGGKSGIEEATAKIVRIVPLGLALSWMIMTSVNMLLAQGALARFNRAIRGRERFLDFEVPRALSALFVAGLALSFFPDPAGMLGLAIAGLAMLPFAIAGIATVHVLAGRLGDRRRMALIGFYMLFVFLGWPLLALLGALGAIDHWFGLRARFGASNLPARKEE